MAEQQTVLRVQHGRIQPPASQELRLRLYPQLQVLERRLRSVGRVVTARGRVTGTAWISSGHYAITTAKAAQGAAAVEFYDLRVKVQRVVVADDAIAVLELEDDAELPQPIPLSLAQASDVLVASDFASVAIGETKKAPSGSPLFDIDSAAIVGMHPKISAATIRAKAKKYVNVLPAPPQLEAALELNEEAALTAADYADREGYDPGFLGEGKLRVKLPTSTASDTLEFALGKKKATELKYMHYSVVMSKSRQLCLYSAVNIDGKKEPKGSTPRPAKLSGPWALVYPPGVYGASRCRRDHVAERTAGTGG